jgi:hypothetical protein
MRCILQLLLLVALPQCFAFMAARLSALPHARSTVQLGLFPDNDESLLIKSARAAQEDTGASGLFPEEASNAPRIEKDRPIDEYTDRSKSKQRMKRDLYKEMKEGVPVNRAAKRAAAKKAKKAAKKK